MATTPKETGACWTCRLRHKRCDGSLPICGACAALEISCYNGPTRPEWMDNGDAQRSMAQKLKTEVKKSAKRRRAIALMGDIAKAATDSDDSAIRPSRSQFSSRPQANPSDDRRSSVVPSTSVGFLPLESERIEMDMGLIVGYMDYVFPVIFPFYRASILEGGRSWVLILALQSTSFFNSIASLSSYFFSVVPVQVGLGHASCAADTWEGLRKQSTQALADIQRELGGLRAGGAGRSRENSTRLLASVVQLLGLEVNMMPPSGWRVHLDAATSLFEQLAAHWITDNAEPNATVCPTSHLLRKAPWMTAEPGALRFFSSFLMVADILASTTLEQAPRLRGYHGGKRRPQSLDGIVSLALEDITGCAPEVLFLIGDMAALDAWKKRRLKDVDSIPRDQKEELVRRAALIEDQRQICLEEELSTESSSQNNIHQAHKDTPSRPLEAILDQSNCTFGPRALSPDTHALITRVWAVAARVYLLVIVLGWQPANSDIRSSVSQGIDLLAQVASPCWLRSIIWPLCVVGCLATEDERPVVRSLIETMGALGGLGGVRQASNILENVWGRNIVDGDSWDIAACLNSMGHAALLL